MLNKDNAQEWRNEILLRLVDGDLAKGYNYLHSSASSYEDSPVSRVLKLVHIVRPTI